MSKNVSVSSFIDENIFRGIFRPFFKARDKCVDCNVTLKPGNRGVEATISCSSCKNMSCMTDPECRYGIVKALTGRGGIDRLMLEKNMVREYSGDSLLFILKMVEFSEDIRLNSLALPKAGCQKCNEKRRASIEEFMERSTRDPLNAFTYIKNILDDPAEENGIECATCLKAYNSFLKDMMRVCRRVKFTGISYEDIKPFIMPGFSSTKIFLEPPKNSVFLRSYEVNFGENSPGFHVSLYELPETLEKLYFIIPWEYTMDKSDLDLILWAKDILLKKRPDTIDFLNTTGARSFFKMHVKSALIDATMANDSRPGPFRLEMLSSALVKYTCGLGILEDILRDPHIQDAYVNSPVGLNPLHVVVDGEECTSNVYLSESDVESIISRLRAISGRPFSEASPVLDMDLGELNTRVSAIGNPLSRGLAYAFRRHKKTPWTLPQLIGQKMLSPYASGLLSFMVDGQSSILVTGSRGAGKTSLLSTLMIEIPQCYRILVIEDTPELPVDDMQKYGWKVQGMTTKTSVAGSGAEFQSSDALRAALRLGESALILGEVRGSEAKSLYEAMRVGASGNSVMGTIHGASCKDVFERVVHDIGVPPLSFKATDAVVVCSTVRPKGGVSRERRILEISEVVKGPWEDDSDSVFNSLLKYNAMDDTLIPSDIIDTGRSEAIQMISKKWGITLEQARNEIIARGKMMEIISIAGINSPGIMEAGNYARCMNMFRVICEHNRQQHGTLDHNEALSKWEAWFNACIKVL